MAILIGAFLAILSIAVIAYPFWKSRRAGERVSNGGVQHPAPNTDDPGPELESIYEAISTLQLEHQLGNVPQGLYREQLDAYRVQAAMALKRQMEARERDADWGLEQEISLARAGLARSNGHPARCANCGTAVGAAESHCPECNADISLPETDSREPYQA